MKQLVLSFFVLFLTVMAASAQRPQLHKLSPMLRQMVAQRETPTVCAFIRITDDAERILRQNGCQKLAQAGNIYIAAIPADRLSALSQERNVSRIEARRGTHALMDSMAIHLNALPVYAGTSLPQAYTGKDVVMGIMDIGFDLTHPNFYDAQASNYRIKRLWDQISPDTIGSSLFVGRDYSGERELLDLGCSYDGKQQTHGTHTLGIAAGSGYNSPYRGMAWESDICLVNNATTEDIALIDTADYSKYTFATDALGFKYIFDYAQSVGKPCVVSFSEGSEQDFYGYDVLYYAMLDSLLGPGRILVASAGNNGNVVNFIHKERGRERAGTFVQTSIDRMSLTAKADAPFTLRTTIYNTEPMVIEIPTNEVLAREDSCYTDSVLIDDRMYYITLTAYPSCYIPTETCYDIELRALANLGSHKPLSVEFVGRDADIEVYRNSGNLVTNPLEPELCDATVGRTIHSPSSAPRVICVGATGYRTGITNYLGEYREFNQGNDGRRSSYSSIGPTFDGRIKPDVMAPGSNIISSYSSYYLENNPQAGDIRSDVEHFDFRGRTYSWNSNAGTSMATPAVGGAIALWLQAKPTLTPEEAMDVIAHTSSHYDESLSYPNNEYGYGQIDVYRGLLYILGIDGIEGLSQHQPKAVSILPIGQGQLQLRFEGGEGLSTPSFSIRIFNTSGQLVSTQSLTGGQEEYTIDLSSLPHGVYAVQVNTGQPATTGSTLVRL
ncbi:MAG: S8 family peptidase [Prevotella sp.]|nr:S8 family peptidase [Prevotella sp.]